MKRFMQKAVEVKAQQFLGVDNSWPLGVFSCGGGLFLDLMNETCRVTPGDWIVESNGRRSIVRARDFAAAYEPIDEESEP